MRSKRKAPCRDGCGAMTQTMSGICPDCDPPMVSKAVIVHRAATHGGVVHAVYERWPDGGTMARCGAAFVCGKVDDVPAKMISCPACKRLARRFGKLATDSSIEGRSICR